MSTEEIKPQPTDVNKKNSLRDDNDEEGIGQEWWDRNLVWHTRSPYVTGELMDKLKPYIEKLKTTPAWQGYDKYFRSIGPFTEEMSLEKRWKIAREWYEREDPKAFWEKYYKEQENKEQIKKTKRKGKQKNFHDRKKVTTTE